MSIFENLSDFDTEQFNNKDYKHLNGKENLVISYFAVG